MTAATRRPGWLPASASGPPSSLASSSTFDKGAEGPGRPRRTSPPPRAQPPRRPGTPLRRTGDAPEDGRRCRASEDGPVSHVPGSFSPPVTLYRPHHVPPDCHPPPSPRGCGPARTVPPVAASSPTLGARSRRGGCRPEPSPGCPSRRLTKPPMPKKTPRLKPPGSAFSPLGPECQFSSPKLLPKHPDVASPPSPASAPDRTLAGPFGEGHPTQPVVLQGSRTSHCSLFQLTSYPCASH